MEEKYHFYVECFTNGKQVRNSFCPDWYGITEEQATWLCIGISVGMRFKYKHPKILCYKVKDNGEKVLYREQR